MYLLTHGKCDRFKAHNAPKKGGNMAEPKVAKTAYSDVKHVTRHVVWLTNSETEKEEFGTLSLDVICVFRTTKQIDPTNQSVVGENCVCNDAGGLAITDKDTMKTRVEL